MAVKPAGAPGAGACVCACRRCAPEKFPPSDTVCCAAAYANCPWPMAPPPEAASRMTQPALVQAVA